MSTKCALADQVSRVVFHSLSIVLVPTYKQLLTWWVFSTALENSVKASQTSLLLKPSNGCIHNTQNKISFLGVNSLHSVTHCFLCKPLCSGQPSHPIFALISASPSIMALEPIPSTFANTVNMFSSPLLVLSVPHYTQM